MYNLQPDVNYVWSIQTYVLFTLVTIFSFILPNFWKVKLVRKSKVVTVVPIGLIIDVVILVCLKGFSNVGRDVLSGYHIGFESATNLSNYSDDSVELGYRVLNVIVHNIWDNYTFFLVIVAIFTVTPVAYVAWKYRQNCPIGITMGLYTAIYYFQGLSLVRIYLAASIGLIVFDKLIQNKKKQAILYIIIASLFHRSMLILFLPYIMYRAKKFSKGIYTIILIITFFILYILSSKITSTFSGRYEVYRNIQSAGLGFQQLIYILPIVLLLVYARKISVNFNPNIYRMSWIVIIFSFFIGELGYVISILGRAQVASLSIIFVVAYSIEKIAKKSVVLGEVIKILTIIYGLVRLYIYLAQYYNIDSIMPYSTVWGWIF